MKKTLILTSSAFALVLAAQAHAQDINVQDNAVAVDDSVAFANSLNGNDLSNNSDNSNNSVANSNNDNSNNSVANSNNDNSNNSVANSNNDNSNNSVANSNNDTSNIANSNNDNSVNDSFWTKIQVDAVVTASQLEAEVSNNTVATGLGGAINSTNTISEGAFAGATGVTQFSQNGGANGLTQQNVTVQGNVTLK